MTPLLLLLAACADKVEPTDSDPVAVPLDADLDGYPDAEDCAPNNAAVNPGVTELCDGQDNNCDGVVDEGLGSTWYPDADADGFGADSSPVSACEKPEGHVPNAGDCDDTDPDRAPGATERCDGVDNNCDGATDEGLGQTWYTDADGDGWGDPDHSTQSCAQPSGTVSTAGDCDDSDPSASPDGVEVCGGGDEDCDGVVDEGDAVGAFTWFRDVDGDGYGDAYVQVVACGTPSGYTADNQDCEDRDAAVFPGAEEWCDGQDNNCDGLTDEPEALDAQVWYADADADGYGLDGSTTAACVQPSGYAEEGADCDDTDSGVYPGATETCDGTDEDCDGVADNGVLGTGALCPAEDCAEVLADNPSARDGAYTLTRGGYTCDMSTDGGGWTEVASGHIVSGTTADLTAYNSEGFTWTEVLFAYSSGSVYAHCTYPTDLATCLNLGFMMGSESWGVPLNFGSTICGLGTVDYSSATTLLGGDDFSVSRASSTDTVRLAVLEAVAYCTTWDNSGSAAVDIRVRR